MAELVSAQFGRVDDRALWRPSTQTRWTLEEMAITHVYRESPDDTPGCPLPSRRRNVPVYVTYKHLRAWIFISLTRIGVGFYVGIVIAGMSSYACL